MIELYYYLQSYNFRRLPGNLKDEDEDKHN